MLQLMELEEQGLLVLYRKESLLKKGFHLIVSDYFTSTNSLICLLDPTPPHVCLSSELGRDDLNIHALVKIILSKETFNR